MIKLSEEGMLKAEIAWKLSLLHQTVSQVVNAKEKSSFFFGCTACGISVPWPGIEPVPPAVEARSLNHWTTREVPEKFLKEIKSATPVNTWMIRKWNSFSDLDRQSNQPQHSLQPKSNPEQGPNSLQFYEGWERWGASEENCETNRGWFMRFKERSHLLQGEAASADVEDAAN